MASPTDSLVRRYRPTYVAIRMAFPQWRLPELTVARTATAPGGQASRGRRPCRMDTLDAAAVTATCARTQARYRLHIAVPWVQLRFTPAASRDLGFDFAINDKDEVDKPHYKALWRDAGDDYVSVGAIGVLRLAEK